MATEPTVPVTDSPALRYSYDQLSPARRQEADRVAAVLMMIDSIDKLPEEYRTGALDALRRGDIRSVIGSYFSWANSGVQGVASGGEAAVDFVAAQAGMDTRSVGILRDMYNGLTMVPSLAAGLPGAIWSDARSALDTMDNERLGTWHLFGSEALTQEQATAIGAAFASAAQVGAEQRGDQGFFQGLFSKDFGTYLSASIGYVSQYVTYVFDHIFGEGAAQIQPFDQFLQQSYTSSDMPFIADALRSAGTIAGVSMTERVVGAITEGAQVTTREGDVVQIGPVGTLDPAQVGGATPVVEEPSALGELAAQAEDTLGNLGPLGLAGAGVGAYATWRVGEQVVPRAANVVTSTAIGTARLAGALASGGLVGTAQGMAGTAQLASRLLPSLRNLPDLVEQARLSAALQAMDIADRRAVSAEIRRGMIDSNMAEAAGDAARTRMHPLRQMLGPFGDAFARVAEEASEMGREIQAGALRASSALQTAAETIHVPTPAERAAQAATLREERLVGRVTEELGELRGEVTELRRAQAAEATDAVRAASGVGEVVDGASDAARAALRAAQVEARTAQVAEDLARVGIAARGAYGLGRVAGRSLPVLGLGATAWILFSPDERYRDDYNGESLSPMDMAAFDHARPEGDPLRLTDEEYAAVRSAQTAYWGTGALGFVSGAVTEVAQLSNDELQGRYSRYIPASLFTDTRALETKLYQDLPTRTRDDYPLQLNRLIEARVALEEQVGIADSIREEVRLEVEWYARTAFGVGAIGIGVMGPTSVDQLGADARAMLAQYEAEALQRVEEYYGVTLADADRAREAAIAEYGQALEGVFLDSNATIALLRATEIIDPQHTQGLYLDAFRAAVARGDVEGMPPALQALVTEQLAIEQMRVDAEQYHVRDSMSFTANGLYANQLMAVQMRQDWLMQSLIGEASDPAVAAYLDTLVGDQLAGDVERFFNQLDAAPAPAPAPEVPVASLSIDGGLYAAAVDAEARRAAAALRAMETTGGDTVEGDQRPEATAMLAGQPVPVRQ